VARLGGDEFVVLAANIDDAGSNTLQTRLEHALAARNAEQDRPYRLAFSVGVSLLDPQGSIAIDRLISEADAHMYERKRERRATQLCVQRDPRLDGEQRQSASITVQG
jgi:diguanylate cyclase (GGDEF)-like protein